MSAPEGNKYYMNRKKHGRELIFKTPGLLLEKAYEYFNWCDENPWKIKEAIKSGAATGTIIDIPTQRPYTIENLCVYLGINKDTFSEYSKRDDFSVVTTHVREIIEANQLEGAIVGAYNPNIIARKLGLTEKTDVTSNGKELATITGMIIK
jgi:hypothetical protein